MAEPATTDGEEGRAIIRAAAWRETARCGGLCGQGGQALVRLGGGAVETLQRRPARPLSTGRVFSSALARHPREPRRDARGPQRGCIGRPAETRQTLQQHSREKILDMKLKKDVVKSITV